MSATNGKILRVGLILLAVPQAITGLWALFAPRSFYDDFPGIAGPWVNVYGEFDPHLTGDIGASFTALAVLLLLAAAWMEVRLVQASLVAWLVFSIPHLVFHLRNIEGPDVGLSLAGLVAQVVGGAALLVLALRRGRSPARI